MKSYNLFTEAIKNNSPKIGEFVIITTKGGRMEPYAPEGLESFFNNNIGKIDRIETGFVDTPNIRVIYKNIKVPKGFEYNFYGVNHTYHEYKNPDTFFTWVSPSNIKYKSKTKKELELKLMAQKYNL